MKKFIVVVVLIIIFAILSSLLLSKRSKAIDISGDWKKIDISNSGYFEEQTVEIDLNGDKKDEKVEIKKSGKFLFINNKNYVINKYYATEGIKNYDDNSYYLVDLNGDGIIEIFHRTFSNMISPISNVYTIYNFVNGELIEVGEFSIFGTMPDEVYVLGNNVKFYYHPYESPEDYFEEVNFKLNVKE